MSRKLGVHLGEARYAGRRKLEVGVVGIRAVLQEEEVGLFGNIVDIVYIYMLVVG